MQYSAYPDYQLSKLAWFDYLPEHWEEKKLKFVCKFGTGWTPPTKVEKYFHGENLWATIRDMKNRFIEETALSISDEAVEEFNMFQVQEGSLLYSFKLSVGKVAFVAKPMFTNEAIFYVLPSKDFSINFLYYLFPIAIIQNANENIYGAKILNQEKIKNAFLTFPPIHEQQKIAAFLDYKVGQIDQLIERKKALVKILEEKRNAVITKAVTKGLDINAKLKSSGVDWLGEMPEGWRIRKLRFIGVCQNGINIGAEFFGRGDPFVSYGDVYNNKELPTDVKGLVQSSDNDKKSYSVESGDILFTRTSETIEEIGFSSVCMNTIEEAVFAGFLIRVRPDADEINKEFSKYYFQNILLRAFFIKEMNLVTRASLSQELLKRLPVLLPSLKEQHDIVKYLDEMTTNIDQMAANIQSAIEKLTEYKSAIITSAVTGKIDVREVEMPKEVA